MEFGRSIEVFSEEELREYARGACLYEITHLVRAAPAIEAARADLFPMNFAIEVFALHLRNLLNFFAPVIRARPMRALVTSTRIGKRPSWMSTRAKPGGWPTSTSLT